MSVETMMKAELPWGWVLAVAGAMALLMALRYLASRSGWGSATLEVEFGGSSGADRCGSADGGDGGGGGGGGD